MSPLRTTAATVCLVALLPGCRQGEPPADQAVAQCANLSGARRSKLAPLREATEAIIAAGHDPHGLRPAPPPADQNAAHHLAEALGETNRERLLGRLRRLTPTGRFRFDQPQLDKIAELLKGNALLWYQVRRAGKATACLFDDQPDRGLLGGMLYLDDAEIASRMHLLSAGNELRKGDLPKAIEEIDAAFLWADRLGRVPRLEARLLAFQLRGGCLAAIATIAGRDDFQPTDLAACYALIRRSLADWPADRDCLIGDRAAAMHAYEAARKGMYDRLITDSERTLLEGRGVMEKLVAITPQAIDRDQLAYLDAMNGLIQAAALPPAQRSAAVAKVREMAAAPRGGRLGPAPLATNLFLPGVADGFEELQRDRAACEIWAVALAAAGGLDTPPYRDNPLTGQPYTVRRDAGLVTVEPSDPQLRPALCPVLE